MACNSSGKEVRGLRILDASHRSDWYGTEGREAWGVAGEGRWSFLNDWLRYENTARKTLSSKGVRKRRTRPTQGRLGPSRGTSKPQGLR